VASLFILSSFLRGRIFVATLVWAKAAAWFLALHLPLLPGALSFARRSFNLGSFAVLLLLLLSYSFPGYAAGTRDTPTPGYRLDL